MNFKENLIKINNFINKFEIVIILIFFTIALSLSFLIIYFNILAKNNFAKINKQRTELATIFGKWENIKNQQKKVEANISKDKNFKLGYYAAKIIKEQNLKSTSIGSPIIQPAPSINYEEVAIIININQSTTEELVELLKKIEANELVYIKKIDITPQNKIISYSIVLATLQPKVTINV